MATDATQKVRELPREATTPKIRWDDRNMKSSYANVCNVSSTREEVVLFFGLSHPTQSGEPEVTVQLAERVILSPFAAKRLAALLQNVVEQYEERFGRLGAASTASAPGSGSSSPTQAN